MELYLYAKSSHRDGLENVRRCSALARMLEEFEPTLCTGDYRAASIAKDTLGVGRTMGIDAVGNLPYTMERLDMLIYDNDEVTPEMHKQMDAFCSRLYKVGKEIPFDIVDEEFFAPISCTQEKGVFFGDDDYSKWFLHFCEGSALHDVALLNGNYFFFDSASELAKSFQQIKEEEEYILFIKSTKYLLTASVQAALESLAAGNAPVYFKRGDKELEAEHLIQKYNIPRISGKNLDAVMHTFDTVCKQYPQTRKIERFDISQIKKEVAVIFEKYAHIKPALDYGYYYANK